MSPNGPLQSGQHLRGEKYRIVELLGRGGTGWVYLALELHLQREVVIKIIDPELLDDDVTKSALLNEARAAAKLDHPNIIKVFTLETEQIDGIELTYIVMEYASEGDLRDAFPDLVQSDLDRYKIMIDVCKGLEYAHNQKFIHRDLKPDNLFVRGKTTKLGDLGTIKSIGEKTRPFSTQGIMTPVYSSPEQLQFKGLDERSDVYTLGIIFFEIMTGKRPYKSFNDHLNDDPPPLITDLVPKLDENVARIIGKMMAKPVEARYQTVTDILNDFRQVPEIQAAGLFEESSPDLRRPSQPMQIQSDTPSPPAAQAPAPVEQPAPTTAATDDYRKRYQMLTIFAAILILFVAVLLVLVFTDQI